MKIALESITKLGLYLTIIAFDVSVEASCEQDICIEEPCEPDICIEASCEPDISIGASCEPSFGEGTDCESGFIVESACKTEIWLTLDMKFAANRLRSGSFMDINLFRLFAFEEADLSDIILLARDVGGTSMK